MPNERHAHLNSLPFRMALFFAINPDEELTTGDVAAKFDVPIEDVRSRLQNACEHGMFEYISSGPGKGKQAVYRAGAALLVLVGGSTQRAMIAACMPLRVTRVTIMARNGGE